jgi:preprotein translocase subunit SecG
MDSPLTAILLTIHIMLAVALIGVVLLQRSEGGIGGLGGGGMSGFMTTRGSANLLTRTTRWLAGAFMAMSLALAWIAAHDSAREPLTNTQPPPFDAPTVPMPDQGTTAPSSTSSPAAGAAPAAPIEPTVPTNQ